MPNPLLEMLEAVPKGDEEGRRGVRDDNNEPREEMLDAFREFSDERTSAVDRMDALALFIELLRK